MAKSFENSMKELETVVEKLESGDVNLEEALECFEQGIKLSKACRKMLDEAEKKVTVLLNGADGEKEKQNFIGEEE